MTNFRHLSFLAIISLALALCFGPIGPRFISFLQGYFPRPKQSATPVYYAAPTASSIPGTFSRKIIAIGDLHGDLPNALKVLRMAHVTDEHGDWSGEVDFLVQTGDIVDR